MTMKRKKNPPAPDLDVHIKSPPDALRNKIIKNTLTEHVICSVDVVIFSYIYTRWVLVEKSRLCTLGTDQELGLNPANQT